MMARVVSVSIGVLLLCVVPRLSSAQICVRVDEANDSLAAEERTAAVRLVKKQFELAGHRVVEMPCDGPYTLSHIRLGNTIIVSLSGQLGSREGKALGLDDAGRRLLDRTASMLPPDIKSVRKINEIGSPAQVILDSADNVSADLVVVGARGRGRLSEVVLGSVSHRVLMHGSRPTLIARGSAHALQRVLVAVQGREDADRITHWLTQHRFAGPVELCVVNVVVPVGLDDPYDPLGAKAWWDAAERHAEDFVKSTAAKLLDSRYTVSTKVAVGSPAATLAEEATKADLVVVASHGRRGISRFLMGSVSHAVVHHATCPVLVVR